MHYLDRNSIPIPACLAERVEGRTYSRLSGAEKAQIRNALLNLQGNRCAYCERRTGDAHDEGHIEHFRKQADHGDLTTTWENLYWSCKDEKTCGKHKDNCTKTHGQLARPNANDLIDPGIDDPDRYLLFVEDGTVVPRPGIDTDSQRRAKETLRVFQLGESALLKQSRFDALRPYKTAVKQFLARGDDSLVQYLDAVREDIQQAPFSAAIRHYFEGIL